MGQGCCTTYFNFIQISHQEPRLLHIHSVRATCLVMDQDSMLSLQKIWLNIDIGGISHLEYTSIFFTHYMAFGNHVRLCWQVGVGSLFKWPRSWRKYCSVMCEADTWARHMGLQSCSLIIGWPICIQIPPSYFLHFMFNKMVLRQASKVF